ncbi:MAG: glutamate racemase [Spirochaetaceae bacterium]|nr:glutamate racemase [Spirochaetaceae bacterium]
MTDKNLQNCIVFLDSGAGGLTYLGAYAELNPRPLLLYVADKKNFPYGKKTKNELVSILIELTGRIKKHFSPALITLACNTASVSALAELRQNFPDTDFVGTVPAVKPAMLASKKKHIAVLGTERTLQDDYIQHIAETAAGDCAITRLAAGELVDFVERRFEYSDKAEKIAVAKKYIKAARESGADALVLGCTHFLFLLDEFKEAAPPDIAVFDSMSGVCGRIENIFAKNDKAKTPAGHSKNLLLVTGAENAEEQWSQRAARFNLERFKPRDWDSA